MLCNTSYFRFGRRFLMMSLLIFIMSSFVHFSDRVRSYNPSTTYLPLVMKDGLTSHYMTITDTANLFEMGQIVANQSIDAQNPQLVVLFFGQPWALNGVQGVNILDDDHSFRSTTDVMLAAESWINGFWAYVPSPGPQVVLSIATNNYGPMVTATHGAAWANMVKDVANFVTTYGMSGQISVMGGSNMELLWNTPTNTINWANAYNNVPGRMDYLYAGDCSGCPYDANPNWSPDNGWTLENIYDISYGILSAYPLPQMYNTNGTTAQQWRRIAEWGFNNGRGLMRFRGVLSQYQACIDRPDSDCLQGITNNTPDQAYQQLWNELNFTNPLLAQTPLFSTDVRWDLP